MARLRFLDWPLAHAALQSRPWHEHKIRGHILHVIYGLDDVPMFINKELCAILGVSDTALTYWKRKVKAEECETSSDFRLMWVLSTPFILSPEELLISRLPDRDQCREIFKGRATYTVGSPHVFPSLVAIILGSLLTLPSCFLPHHCCK